MDFPVLNIFPYTSFHYCNKEPKPEKDRSVAERFARMQANFDVKGMRTTVEGILVVHHNTHPYILSLKFGAFYKLPGGRLRPGENEIEGLRRKLTSKLGCILHQHQPDWQIGERVATWWRPYFDRKLYLEPRVPEPKECKKLFIVHLAEGIHIATPENFMLVCMPLVYINKRPEVYGPVISQIPDQLLSQFWFNFIFL